MNENQIDPQRVEALGPAKRVVDALTSFTDHMVHNRPGIVVPDANAKGGVRWSQATWRLQEDGSKHVFRCDLNRTGKGKKTTEVLIGTLRDDGKVVNGMGRAVAEFREPGLFPEIVEYLYGEIAKVFEMDADFAAHWASWAFSQDRRDLKTVLAAFMLTQKHAGAPVVEGGEVLFYDDDFRSVGEAMILIREKGQDLSPKQILLIGEILRLPQVHAINRRLGFSKSARNPQMRRYKKAVAKWLRYREQNPKMFDGLIKAGWGNTVQKLAQVARYKPVSQDFFAKLRWKQTQSGDGHREVGLDLEIETKATWEGLSETEICERITAEQPGWLTLVGNIPSTPGLTPAIFVAAVEAGCISPKQVLGLGATIEDLGVQAIPEVAALLKRGVAEADDLRAAHQARNVKTAEMKEILESAADTAAAKAMEKATKDLRVYFVIDKSGSMEQALEAAKRCLAAFVGAFPLDRTHVSMFNSRGVELQIQAARRAAVEHAFSKHSAGGGTRYAEGVKALAHHQPKDDEDVLMIFVGDGAGESGMYLANAIRNAGLRPTGFIWGKFAGWGGFDTTVVEAARILEIPCVIKTAQEFEQIFDDPYAVTQTLTHLIESTPVGAAMPGRVAPRRVDLVEKILKTPLLAKPAWAA